MQTPHEDISEAGLAERANAFFALAFRWMGGAVSLALVALILIWVYRLGVRDAQELPVIKARLDPARVRPVEPGGREFANQGLAVNSVLSGGAAQGEGPSSRAPGPQELAGEDTTPPAIDQPPPEVVSLGPAVTPSPQPRDLQNVINQLVTEAAADPQGETEASSGPAELRPRVRPRSGGATPASRAATVNPSELPTGAEFLNLGTFPTNAEAEQAWINLLTAEGALLSGRQPLTSPVDVNGIAFQQLRLFGFAASGEAGVLCEALRSKGVGCSVGATN